MEHVVQFDGPLEELRISGHAGPVVLDLSKCPELNCGPHHQSHLRSLFTRLMSQGVEVSFRGASPEVTTALHHLRAQTLMRHAERANPALFAQAG